MRDVAVVGGGPAGATAAALLAQAGHDVVVVERDAFPRERVGESLLPLATPVLERLGIDLAPTCLFKRGAEFVDEAADAQVEFRFDQGYAGAPSAAWQVERAVFDALLLDRARAAGAEVRHGVRARDVEVDGQRVRLDTDAGEIEARYLVDASGPQTFLARRAKSIVPCRDFGRAAAFGWFTGLDDAAREELEATGNIKVLLTPDGWAWLIPLRGGKLSVGFVQRTGTLTADSFARGVAGSPLIQRLTRGAVASPPKLVGDFSYANARPHGARTVCVGDAACFLDPVFSSGVSLALAGSAQMADLLAPALLAGTEAEPNLMAPLSARLDVAYRTFAAFIGRFYNTRLVQNLFFAERPDPDIFVGIVGILSGDLWRDDNPFQTMLLGPGRRNTPWPPSH